MRPDDRALVVWQPGSGATVISREGSQAPDMPPGVYSSADRRVAVNALTPETELSAASWPVGTTFIAMAAAQEQPLQAALLLAALALLCADILATLWLSGRLSPRGATVALAFLLLTLPNHPAQAQTEEEILRAANNTVLAYVETGNQRLDDLSMAGLTGLSTELFRPSGRSFTDRRRVFTTFTTRGSTIGLFG